MFKASTSLFSRRQIEFPASVTKTQEAQFAKFWISSNDREASRMGWEWVSELGNLLVIHGMRAALGRERVADAIRGLETKTRALFILRVRSRLNRPKTREWYIGKVPQLEKEKWSSHLGQNIVCAGV